MNISQEPELLEKVKALQKAARELLEASQPYLEKGNCPISTVQIAYVVAANQAANDVLNNCR